jgi:hypothetical protein
VLVAGTYSKARTIRIEPALDIPTPLLFEVLNRLEDSFKEIQARRFGPPARAATPAVVAPVTGGARAPMPHAAV